MGHIDARLSELGITLPAVAKPVASYVPAMTTGNLLYTAGQLPFVDGKLAKTGKVGAEVSATEAADLARLCTLNALAAAKGELGSLDRVTRVVKVNGFVASTPDFIGQPQVLNGASEVLGEIFGDRGAHARSGGGSGIAARFARGGRTDPGVWLLVVDRRINRPNDGRIRQRRGVADFTTFGNIAQ